MFLIKKKIINLKIQLKGISKIKGSKIQNIFIIILFKIKIIKNK